MMEPRIQYAQTKDGVSIAYAVAGKGVPVIFSFPVSHLSYYLESPVWRSWFEGMVGRYQLVVYDSRGNGLSQRGVTLTPEALALDLEAVVDQLALDDFFVFAPVGYGHGAIHYAVAHPQRIAGLILWACYVNAEAALDRSWVVDFAKGDWELFLRMTAQSFAWLDPGEVRDYVEVLKKSSTQEDYVAFAEAALTSDVGSLLSSVQTPALVLHPRELDFVKVEEAMRLTSMLPNAQLVLLDGARLIPVRELVEPTQAAIAEFIDGITGRAENEHDPAAGGLVTILFTDVEGSTALTDRLGDAKARELLRRHERIVRDALKAHGGSEVKTMGDGFMASFSSASKALECGIAMQRTFAERNESAEEPIMVRVGLNAGEPIAEDDPDGRSDLFGTAVNRAARITAEAKGGEILAANVVRELAEGKDFLFSDAGERQLKGFDEAVRLFEVRWRES